MRPLPRVLAFSDDRVAALEDFGIRAAAIAAVGSAAGLVARLPGGTADQLSALALRCASLVRPPEAALFVTGRVDIAMAAGASGTILRERDLGIEDARRVTAAGAPLAASRSPHQRALWLLRSVHSVESARAAITEGADGLILGSIWATASHPGRAPVGVALLREVVALGLPTFAIGGVTPERSREVQKAGAWGVAAIGALWDAPDPYLATRALLAPWLTA
ncbi:MAG: thiamine phosphate synthase [Gemmatimonadota bacterium]